MRVLAFALLVLGAFGADAAEVKLRFFNHHWSVVDLAPHDGVAPSYTLSPSSLSVAEWTDDKTWFWHEISWADYHFSGTTAPSDQPRIAGVLGPQTEVAWTADGEWYALVANPADPTLFESLQLRYSFCGHTTYDPTPGCGGNEPLYMESQSPATAPFTVVKWGPARSANFLLSNPTDAPVEFFIDFAVNSFSIQSSVPMPSAIPEPSTWAMMLLAAVMVTGYARRTRARTAVAVRTRSPRGLST